MMTLNYLVNIMLAFTAVGWMCVVLFVGLIVGIFLVCRQAETYGANFTNECHAKGGRVIRTEHGMCCIRNDAFIDIGKRMK